MKAAGMVKKIDQLGKIVFWVELRRTFDIKTGDPLEIYVDEDNVLFKKYLPDCIFCGEVMHVINYRGKNICWCWCRW